MKKILILGFVFSLFAIVASAQTESGNKFRQREVAEFRHHHNRFERRHFRHHELGMNRRAYRRHLAMMRRREMYRYNHRHVI